MSVRIVSSGVQPTSEECRKVIDRLNTDAAMLICTLNMIRSGDNSAIEPCKEYIRELIRIMDSSSFQAEIVMRLSFMKDGLEYFSKKLNEIEKAGEN